MGVLDDFARQVGWNLSQTNVIVEGTSDVRLFLRASELHRQAFAVPILDAHFQVCAAGQRDDGGVEGVNRMLVTAQQLAVGDRHRDGGQRYRFIGLLDNDPAGRRGLNRLTDFTSRLQAFRDIFLLFPDMPICDNRGMAYVQEKSRHLKKHFNNSRFEIEDLISERLVTRFEKLFPGAIVNKEHSGTRHHYHFSRAGKVEFQKFALSEGKAEDFADFFAVTKALRSYLQVDHAQIRTLPW